MVAFALPRTADASPEGEMTWAVNVSLAPAWFDPAETPSVVTPFMESRTHAAGSRPSAPPPSSRLSPTIDIDGQANTS